MNEEINSITVRFPANVRDAVKQRATNRKRSFNSEVIWELEHYQTGQISAMGRIPNSRISEEDLQPKTPEVEEVWRRYSIE